MIIEAGPDDRAAIEALLAARLDQAMFPLTNLRDHGLAHGDFASPHDHATRFWRTGNSLIGLTRSGMILPLLDGNPELSGLKTALNGLTVIGSIGPAYSVRPVLSSLGVSDRPARIDEDQPGMAVDLGSLRVPNLKGARLVAASSVSRKTLVNWRAASTIESQGMPRDEALDLAAADIDAYLVRDSHRVLLLDDQPVAMTGFNAILPEIVQIGGVYTPPDLRRRGFARQAVAMHLAEAGANGVTRAVLFAASEPAVRAYRAIGFQPAQPFTLFLLSTPMQIATCP